MTPLKTFEGKSAADFAVRFLLSTNLPGSMTRITAETATVFSKLGIPTIVLFPAVDWWDFKLFTISRMKSTDKWKWISKLAREVVTNVPCRTTWCGFKYHSADPKVRVSRYLFTPSARDWKENEITIVHPSYLIPHLLRTIPHRGIKLVSAVHMNLEKAMQSPHPETAAWYRHWVAGDRLISVPRYTTSETAKRAAERLGIPVRKVIYDGSVDLNLFRPAPGRPPTGRLVITLYCDPNLQKGQAVGVEAFKTLKSLSSHMRLCSVGRVVAEYAKVFDHNYGYLHAEPFVKALQDSDIFVYPSLYDGFPAPPLQAMACGAALVTTAVEGVTEYGVHEQNCLLCEPGNAGAIRDQVMRLIQDHELRQRLQSNGPRTAETFSVERSARQLLDFLREVYEEQRGGVASTVLA